MALLMCAECLTITETSDKHIGKVAKCPECHNPGKVIVDAKKEQAANEAMELAIQQASQQALASKREGTVGRIVLTSGVEVLFNAVYMFRTDSIQQIEQLKQDAIQKMTPRSSGIGFIGDIGYVLAASAAVGALTSIVNSSAQSKGDAIMQEYYRRRLALRSQGEFRWLYTIKQIQFADPGLWVSVPEEEESDKMSFILSDDSFVSIRTVDGAPLSIRWQAVEQYWVSVG